MSTKPSNLSRLLLASGSCESLVILAARGLIENDINEVNSDDPSELGLPIPEGMEEPGLYVFTFQLGYSGSGEDGVDLHVTDPVVRGPNAHELAAIADGNVAAIPEMWADVPAFDEMTDDGTPLVPTAEGELVPSLASATEREGYLRGVLDAERVDAVAGDTAGLERSNRVEALHELVMTLTAKGATVDEMKVWLSTGHAQLDNKAPINALLNDVARVLAVAVDWAPGK